MSNHPSIENEKNNGTFQENGKSTYIILRSPALFNEVRSVVQAISEERVKKGNGAQLKIKSLRAGSNNGRFYKAISFFRSIEGIIKKIDEKIILEPEKKLEEWDRKVFGAGSDGDESIFNFGTGMDERTGHAVKTLGLKDAVSVLHCDSDSIVICDSADTQCTDNNNCDK